MQQNLRKDAMYAVSQGCSAHEFIFISYDILSHSHFCFPCFNQIKTSVFYFALLGTIQLASFENETRTKCIINILYLHHIYELHLDLYSMQ